MLSIPTFVLSAALAATSLSVSAQSFLHTGSPDKHNRNAKKSSDGSSATVDANVMPSMTIHSGILTVDGMVAKARLNYEVRDARFFYFSVPGTGTAIVSLSKFPNAQPQDHAFHGDMLTVEVGGHTIELSSAGTILGKNDQTAWVALDEHFTLPTHWPAVGFGDSEGAPYAWPGSAPSEPTLAHGVAIPPPLPKSMLPTQQSSYSVTEPAKNPKH